MCVLSGCLDGAGCGNTIIQTAPSPGGNSRAIIFTRDCGATTGFSTQVSILPTQDALPNESGNVFMSDADHGTAPAGRGGGPNVWVKWLAPNQLKIVYDRRARTFDMKKQVGNIVIVYKKQ